ncbi:MAG: sulfatase-like hydrolase/transferase [Armatimonadota bacterium]
MAERPNILLMVSDQHSGQVMGCAGDDLVRTPHLDSLAGRGVIFDACHCAAPLCVPSRMTMLTGRHCSDIEVWTNHCQLPSHAPTFAHALGAVGYETVLCGRMHFVGPDQRHGFHRRIMGELSDHRFPGGPVADLGEIPLASTGQCRTAVEVAGPGRTSYQAYDEAVAQTAAGFLRQRAERDDRRPFLLTAGFVLPHCPFIAPSELYEYYHERIDVPELPEGYLDGLHPAMKAWREARGITDLTDAEIRAARAGYYGIVEHFDGIVGGLMAAVEECGLAEETVVIYVSDHGESAGRNGLWWKSQFYDHSVRVPMIVAGPGLPACRRRREVVSLLDLAPTLTDLAGAARMPAISGQSLLPLVRDELPARWRDEAIAEMIGIGPHYPYPGRMVRQGPWKLMHYEDCEPLLFNLDEDPNEFEDRAGDPQCREVREYLHDRARWGWDPDAAMRRVGQRVRDARLIRDWREAWEGAPDSIDHWPAPEGVNVWPG